MKDLANVYLQSLTIAIVFELIYYTNGHPRAWLTYIPRFRGGMVKTSALYTKGRRFEPHRRRFFTPTVVLLSFKKPETVLWTIAKILYYYYHFPPKLTLSSEEICAKDLFTLDLYYTQVHHHPGKFLIVLNCHKLEVLLAEEYKTLGGFGNFLKN